MSDLEHSERALRTIKRSLATADAAAPPRELTKLLFSAVNLLVFLVEKLMEEPKTSGDSSSRGSDSAGSTLSLQGKQEDREDASGH